MEIRGTIVVPDQHARLKPCLRCGYSLLGIASARNCPECGLAVRITLSGNSRLEWTSPRWQRVLSFAYGIMVLACLCTLISTAIFWIRYLIRTLDWPLGESASQLAYSAETTLLQTAPLFWGVALCLLATGEGRHPDRSRPPRYVALSIGITLLTLALIRFQMRYGLLPFFGPRARFYVARFMSGPWIPLAVSVITCAFVSDLAKRADSRLLPKAIQLPLWIAPAALVFWLFSIDRLIWPLRPLLRDCLFPLSMLPMLILTTLLLLRGAREATANWVSDP